MPFELVDRFNRRFSYLRLSITDVCNFRCAYCLPYGYKKLNRQNNFLTINEIKNLISAFSTLGLKKVRITGGEPLIRKDLEEIISAISSYSNIETVALSTNGFNLKKRIYRLYTAGMGAVNVSVDSLEPDVFSNITGRNELSNVLAGIERAIEIGVPKIKLNSVLMKNTNPKALEPFLNYIKNRPVGVRFIELMENGTNKSFFEREHNSGENLYRYLKQTGWHDLERDSTDGPAKVLYHPDYQGTIGFIMPYSADFCSNCNRLRVTALGQLRLCLFSSSGFDLRPLLNSSHRHDELVDFIKDKLLYKKYSHHLQYRITGDNKNFAQMGG